MPTAQDLKLYLDRATVSPEVFKLRPDYRALLIAISGISPGASNELSETLLQQAESSAKAQLAKTSVTELPHIAAWREAYKAFGVKPNKNRNSLEALTRRVDASLPRVNRLTDIYNAISVKHQIPLGGEDLDKYNGPARLIRASGNENFVTTVAGQQTVEHPFSGEVVWCDDAGVTCRIWNWRQGPRTALSDQTTNALFILDTLEPCSDDDLTAAANELVSALSSFCPDLQTSRRLLEHTKTER
jgi:DNA/RNA-binding domain of Phe-tRNA-synthetase-like protein